MTLGPLILHPMSVSLAHTRCSADITATRIGLPVNSVPSKPLLVFFLPPRCTAWPTVKTGLNFGKKRWTAGKKNSLTCSEPLATCADSRDICVCVCVVAVLRAIDSKVIASGRVRTLARLY